MQSLLKENEHVFVPELRAVSVTKQNKTKLASLYRIKVLLVF